MNSLNPRNLNGRYDDVLRKIIRIKLGRSLRVIDLFAGCGGMSLGFHRANYEIIGGVELDQKAAQTHALNFFGPPDSRLFEIHSQPHDITKLPPQAFMTDILQEKDPSGLVDVIIGGPPCQAFARIGRAKLREIMQHPQAFLQDERSDLYTNFLEYVEFFHPLAVLMENVVDIMNYGGKNIAEEIAASLEELGYVCHYTILNAAHYGVPQMRQRFFLIAVLETLEITPTFPVPTHYMELPPGYESARQVALKSIDLFNMAGVRYVYPVEPEKSLPHAITAQEALHDLPPITSHLEGKMKRGVRDFNQSVTYRTDVKPSFYAAMMREWPGFETSGVIFDHVTRYLPRDFILFSLMRHGDQYPEVYELATRLFREELEKRRRATGIEVTEGSPEFENLRASVVPPYDPGKFPNKWRKIEPDQPVRTLTAHIGKDTYSHIHYDSKQARVISVREAARLQSFPDRFKFTGPMNTAFRQIGNAVPPLMAFALAKHIHSMLIGAADRIREVQYIEPG
jgi:DNA (cytosine-5)-methyltransferase 1